MRQNRDGSEAFSAGACVSAGRGFCLCLGAFLPTAFFCFSAPEFRSLCAFCLLGLLALFDCLFSPVPLSPPLYILLSSLSLPLWPCYPLRLSCAVCLQVPGPMQTFLSSKPVRDCGPTEGRRSPELSAHVLPDPLQARPCWPRPLAPDLPGRAAAAAAIYSRRYRVWSFKPRFPGARLGPTRSLMAPMAANHAPLPPPPRPAPRVLRSGSRPRRPVSDHRRP